MTIALVVDSFADRSNGTSMTAARFAQALKERGHTVRVVAPYVEGEGFYPVRERYIPIVTRISHAQHMVFGAPDPAVLAEAFCGVDIVHLFLPFKLEQVALQVARELRIPYIAGFHLQPEHITYNVGLQKLTWLNRLIFWWFHRRFYRFTPHIHCPSKLIKEELIRAGYGGEKYVISNGFDPQFSPRDSHPNTKGKRSNDGLIHITMVGRYSKEKRQDCLIEAIARNPHRERIKLHLKGLGPLESRLRKLGETLPNPIDFGFAKPEELLQILRQSSLYVHTAEVEGEAIAALEAIACGLVPIIADSKTSATRQFALDSRSLFTAGDARELSEKISYWIEQDEERERASALYAASAKNYSLESSITQMLSVYERIIAHHNTSHSRS